MAGTDKSMTENIKDLAVRVATEFNTLSSRISDIEDTASSALPKTGGTISGNLTVTGGISGSLTGNASSATTLSSSRKISLSGDASGNADFDGSSDISISVTVADDSHNHVVSNIDGLQNTLNAKAALASPTFTGTPKAPTASAGTNTTQIATTAFVTTAVANKTSVTTATKATQDGSGNTITSTYATKSEVGGDSFIGKIEMFYGTLDSTGKHPLVGNVTKTNWQICDGTNGTPDLRDRFVMGAGTTYTSGQVSSGANSVTVDKESFEYSMSTKSLGSTTMKVQTGVPNFVALYYIMKIA